MIKTKRFKVYIKALYKHHFKMTHIHHGDINTNLRVELLLSPGVAIRTVVPRIT